VTDDFETKYVKVVGLDKIADSKLQSLLADWVVASGPGIAIQGLQRVCGVTPDGSLNPATLAAVGKMHPEDVVNGVVAERIKMIGRIVTKNPNQLPYLNSWLSRTVEWLG